MIFYVFLCLLVITIALIVSERFLIQGQKRLLFLQSRIHQDIVRVTMSSSSSIISLLQHWNAGDIIPPRP